MATSANDVLVERNRYDATALESMWERELSVPLFAVDDNAPEMRKQGKCIKRFFSLPGGKVCLDVSQSVLFHFKSYRSLDCPTQP